MYFKIVHRDDRLLQKIVDRQRWQRSLQLPEGLSMAGCRVLIKFLDDRLRGRQFNSVWEIQDALGYWPAFTAQWSLEIGGASARLVLNFDPSEDEEGEIVAFAEGETHGFIFAKVIRARA